MLFREQSHNGQVGSRGPLDWQLVQVMGEKPLGFGMFLIHMCCSWIPRSRNLIEWVQSLLKQLPIIHLHHLHEKSKIDAYYTVTNLNRIIIARLDDQSTSNTKN